MTITEVANHFQVPVRTLYAWRYHSKGPLGIKVGRYVRYRHEDVEAFLADLVEAETSEPAGSDPVDIHPVSVVERHDRKQTIA